MICAALLRSSRGAQRALLQSPRQLARSAYPVTLSASSRFAQIQKHSSLRFYSAPAGLAKKEVEGRILDILKNFDKVTDAAKLSGTSHFANDLGLDSLDTVEVVMAIEEEFSIEIPDKEADAIHGVEKAVEYILSQPDAH